MNYKNWFLILIILIIVLIAIVCNNIEMSIIILEILIVFELDILVWVRYKDFDIFDFYKIILFLFR